MFWWGAGQLQVDLRCSFCWSESPLDPEVRGQAPFETKNLVGSSKCENERGKKTQKPTNFTIIETGEMAKSEGNDAHLVFPWGHAWCRTLLAVWRMAEWREVQTPLTDYSPSHTSSVVKWAFMLDCRFQKVKEIIRRKPLPSTLPLFSVTDQPGSHETMTACPYFYMTWNVENLYDSGRDAPWSGHVSKLHSLCI